MNPKSSRLVAIAAVTGAVLGGTTVANAVTKHTTNQATGTPVPQRGNPNETALTGDTLKQASDAAIAANAGAKVDNATTEDPAEKTGAAYEVHITKADGTRATVLEDSAFKVLSTTTDQGRRGGHGGHGRNSNEKALTGDTLKQASDAAIAANAGAKVDNATTEDPAEKTGAAYEVHITKADGTRATVLEDSAFKVLSTTTQQGRGGHFGHGANPNEKALTGDDLAKATTAAKAAVAGATIDAATTEDPAENTGAAYEVHAHTTTKQVTVLLDKDFKVIKTETNTGGHHH